MNLIPVALGLGLLLTLGGLAGLAFGIYAFARGGRGQRGGLGGFSVRGIHTIAGLRMLVGGAATVVVGGLMLWAYFSG